MIGRSTNTNHEHDYTTLRLRSGKERPVRLGHPWVFAGAIANLDPATVPGTLVRLESASGEFLGIGAANPRCTIAVRLLTRIDEAIDAAFVHRRVAAALDLRRSVIPTDTDTYRVINGEGDFLPGVVVDRYGDVLVLQCLTAGAAALQSPLIAALVDLAQPRSIYERSAGAVRREEGLPDVERVLHGDPPADRLRVREHGFQFLVDVHHGQKTGLFLDQRDNRALARQLTHDRRVLNAFAYTGGFGVYAGAGGAREVVSVESSARALTLARENWALNDLPNKRAAFVEADVFRYLREPGEPFDLLILDPPALVKQRKDVARGARAYKDLHLQTFRRAAPGALVFSFSCSTHVDAVLFRQIVTGAAADARRAVRVLRHLGSGADHPTSVAQIEGEYLTGLLLQVS
ncbi:MAG: class I SAM-dependent rRNA methyltransferase [Deltaproteobacteria bacterium]|nr:class I SAM-dependent rRNA methyltransferase [Deltaproteobacteria bacterium]MBI3390586.1 class I SAM-dependent rRNA methyltransferase [Deltaproteobacteria bacterium]